MESAVEILTDVLLGNGPRRPPYFFRGFFTPRDWDLIDYLRDEYFNNNQSTPNTRTIIKAMSERWNEKVEQKALYDLFPLDPSKQGKLLPLFTRTA